jgi:acyl-CoA reductase-like NAD-dependent aldehyde dehydrogenase
VVFDDLDAVIDEVNRTEYGLSGSLWGDHLPTLQSLARRMEAARVFLNSPRPVGAIADQMPAGGLKQSGLGWEKSVYGIREYYQYQSINW